MHRLYPLLSLGLGLVFLAPASGHEDSIVRMAELDALIALTPDEAVLRIRRAVIHLEHAAWVEAEADLTAARALDSNHAELPLALAQLYLGSGRPREARAQLDRALKAKPDDAERRVLRARASAQLGDIEAARRDYDDAFQRIASPPPELYLERAALPLPPPERLRGLDEALAQLGPVVSLVERAIALELERGRVDEALARIDRHLATLEAKAPWLRRRGDLLASAGRVAEARRTYTDALAELRRLPPWLQASPEAARLAAELTPLALPSS